MRHFLLAILSTISFSGCLGLPGDLEPVNGFEVERYMGKWYEIYRLDHSFERGLSQVTATYTLQDDGSVKVENFGVKEDGSEDTIVGKALFQGDPTVGSLKVSFFGPFYGGYHVIALDKENYQYAMVAGPSYDFLWILSRTPQLDQETIDALLAQAEESGFDVEGLIFVEQDVAE
jgi:apolipoprotein D and lipocalin family protein